MSENKPFPGPSRFSLPDQWRGLVMVLMVLDHARDFFYAGNLDGNQDPLDFQTTHPALFFTRWITHLCAPTFVALAGFSQYVQVVRSRPGQSPLAGFFVRGMWLVLMELTLVNFAWTFLPPFQFVFLQVIWAIGMCMVFSLPFMRLPAWISLVFGSLLVAFNHLAVAGGDPGFSVWGKLWKFLMVGGPVVENDAMALFVPYPVLPWLGIFLLGFGAGPWAMALFEKKFPSRRLLELGFLFLFLFALLRLAADWGDPEPMVKGLSGQDWFFAFLNVSKYPPSLLYTLATLGVSAILAWVLHKENVPGKSWLEAFGRVPFFFYILHIYLLHVLAWVVFLVRGGHFADLKPLEYFGGLPPGSGFSLVVVYLVWLLVLVVLYVPCRWFHQVKLRNRGAFWIRLI